MGKMSAKLAAFFAKKGEKGLAKHEKREAEGKEKDTKAIAKKEERALKGKGVPKGLKKYEKEEHKEMGFKKGGMAKSKMSMGGIDPRKSYGEGPGIASQMGNKAKGGGIESKGCGPTKKMANGGMARGRPDGDRMMPRGRPFNDGAMGAMPPRRAIPGMPVGRMPPAALGAALGGMGAGMKKGGGVESKGKTQGTNISMKKKKYV